MEGNADEQTNLALARGNLNAVRTAALSKECDKTTPTPTIVIRQEVIKEVIKEKKQTGTWDSPSTLFSNTYKAQPELRKIKKITTRETYIKARYKDKSLNNLIPHYPFLAQKNDIEGKVTLSVNISRTGTPTQIKIYQSSGHKILDNEAAGAVAKIEAAGGRAIADSSDIGSRAGAEALVEACVSAFGSIDIVVNNAGIARDRTFLKMSDEEFGDVWRVHVMGTFWCAQTGAARMREQGGGGSIINTTSAAHMGNFGQTNYAAAKGAIASMTYTMAMELARYGIRVNAICPGLVDTERADFIAAALAPEGESAEEFRADMVRERSVQVPMGRIAQGDDIARIAAFLASSESDYMTGLSISVSGGSEMN